MKAYKIAILVLGAVVISVAVFLDAHQPVTRQATASDGQIDPSRGSEASRTEAEELSTLLPNCGSGDCENDLFKPVWLKFVGDTGEVTKVDSNFQRTNLGTVVVIAYTYVPGTRFDPRRLRRLLFDCAGHYMDVTEGDSPLFDAPPLSIAGKIAGRACLRNP